MWEFWWRTIYNDLTIPSLSPSSLYQLNIPNQVKCTNSLTTKNTTRKASLMISPVFCTWIPIWSNINCVRHQHRCSQCFPLSQRLPKSVFYAVFFFKFLFIIHKFFVWQQSWNYSHFSFFNMAYWKPTWIPNFNQVSKLQLFPYFSWIFLLFNA